jgi:hypothetical protein
LGPDRLSAGNELPVILLAVLLVSGAAALAVVLGVLIAGLG